MAISFTNVRTGEKKTVTTEPAISAYFNSTNLHVNATVGQDLGWRLAPETVKRMREIQRDPQKMQEIAATFQLPLDGIGQTDILNWISREDSQTAHIDQADADYEAQYERELRELEEAHRPKATPKSQAAAPEKTTTSNKPDSNKQSDSAKLDTSNNDTKES